MKDELEPGRRAERSGAERLQAPLAVRDVRACASELSNASLARALMVTSRYSKVMQHRIVGRTRHDVCFAEPHVSRLMARLGILR
jgi:hypothetical protein